MVMRFSLLRQRTNHELRLASKRVAARFLLACAVVVAALSAAGPAHAAELTLGLEAPAGVRLGDRTEVSGRVTDGGAPLAGRTVRLEVRAHPFTGRWRLRAVGQTAADGSFTFAPEFDRNHQVRVRMAGTDPEPDAVSPARFAYVLPRFTLSFSQRGDRVLRLRQRYTVPRDVRLSAPTRFYVGPCDPGGDGSCTAGRAQFRGSAETRRVRAGRYVATLKVRIPKSYGGRFQYLSCFAYSPGSGMGDPEQRCPRRYAKLQ
jgi:hypothetical protein